MHASDLFNAGISMLLGVLQYSNAVGVGARSLLAGIVSETPHPYY